MRTWNSDRTINIPDELKSLNQWVCWKEGKIPVNAKTGGPAKTNDASTWGSFKQACCFYARHPRMCGIGFVFDGAHTGVDIDGVTSLNPLPKAVCSILDRLVSYTEISPSGTGLHVILKGGLRNNRSRIIPKAAGWKKIEVYSTLRYFTFTGDVLAQYPLRCNRADVEAMLPAPKAMYPAPRKFTPVNFTLNFAAEMPVGLHESLCRANARYQAYFDRRIKARDTSLSGSEFALTNFAVQAGWTDQQIVDMLVAFRRKHAGRTKHPAYYVITLTKIRSTSHPPRF